MSTPTGVGRRLAGRYTLDARLWQNEQVEVYRGRDQKSRAVAVTLFRPHLTATEYFRPRFEREARAVSQLRHPAIVPLLDFGLEQDRAFLVYAFASGGTLAERLRGQPLPLNEAGRILGAVGAALNFAYSRGVLHRSLSATNVVFDEQDRVMVAGFGRAVIAGNDSQFGDVHYLAPEQVRGGEGDERSDVYSYGVIAFEVVTGRQPFPGTSALNVMLAQLNEAPPEPISLNPQLPQQLNEALRHALAKDPGNRYQNGGDLAASLGLPAGDSTPTRYVASPAPSAPSPQDYQTVYEGAPPPNLVETPPGPASLPPDQSLPPAAPVQGRRSLTPILLAGVAGLALIILVGVAALVFTLFSPGGGSVPPTRAPAITITPSLPSAEGMVEIAAGTYPLGLENADADHAAARTVELPAFWLDRFEVTNAEYAAYVAGHPDALPYGWENDSYPPGEERHPVRGVTFAQASDYCRAVGKRLPQEAEWEAAARGSEGLLYPWGDDPNAVHFDPTNTHPVGSLAEGESPTGVFDMAGNVWEWVDAPYEPVPNGQQVLRGGSYNFLQNMAYRLPVDPTVLTAIVDAGFRCAATQVQ